jgi:NADH-ubiquinone oxidoreductase chain 1
LADKCGGFRINVCVGFNFFIIVFLLLIICVLVDVAFMVLLESRVLGYVNIHKGPNKVGFLGLFQPFGIAIKL